MQFQMIHLNTHLLYGWLKSVGHVVSYDFFT